MTLWVSKKTIEMYIVSEKERPKLTEMAYLVASFVALVTALLTIDSMDVFSATYSSSEELYGALEKNQIGLMASLTIFISILIFSISFVLWILNVFLFLAAYPFQIMYFKKHGKYMLPRKRKKGLAGFLFNLKEPEKKNNSKGKS